MDDLIPALYRLDDQSPIVSTGESDQEFIRTYLESSHIRWKTVSWREISTTFKNSWVNVEQPLTAADLSGRIVVLDFFTYCCINCMHILPYLTRLESIYSSDTVQIIGVHSAKFLNEKSSANIASAVSRYEIEHPVINDADFVLWRMLGVRCWPTVALFDPEGRLIFWFEGERRIANLANTTNLLLNYYQGRGKTEKILDANLFSIDGTKEKVATSCIKLERRESIETGPLALKFPAKLSISPSKRFLAVSDSGHHRIVILDVAAAGGSSIVKAVIGQKGNPGSADGDFSNAQFRSPQGVCWLNEETLFVADTANHLIRKVDVNKQYVSTFGGTGHQGHDFRGGNERLEQDISSPWDVVIAETETSKPSLLIAAAGTHQIWILPLTDAIVVGKREFEPNRLYCLAGNGREAARNNFYPHQASFAQPSGLSVDGEPSSVVYVADSESSTVRSIDLKTGAVKTVVGGDLNPENLFAFGDVDEMGLKAKLQHPLGVCFCPTNGNLYLADSYNHKIKMIDPFSRKCQSLVLNFGDSRIKNLNEPCGLCVAYPYLYIADTNNHAVWIMDIETCSLRELQIEQNLRNTGNVLEMSDGSLAVHGAESDQEVVRIRVTDDPLHLSIRANSSDEFKLTSDAQHAWRISCAEASVKLGGTDKGWVGNASGELVFSKEETTIPGFYISAKRKDVKSRNDIVLFILDLDLYLCDSTSDVCSVRSRRFIFKTSIEGEEVVRPVNGVVSIEFTL